MASKFLTGLALGVVAGIMLAPDKGTETRRKLSMKGTELKNKFNDFIDSLHDKAEDVKDDVELAAERTKERARAFGNEVGNTWNG